MCVVLRTNAQAPVIAWQQTIGGNENEDLRSIIQNEDGTYVCAGYSNSGISGDKLEANMGYAATIDYWVMKLDPNGDIIWQNTIGGSVNDELHCVRATPDGGYVLGGWSSSFISGDKSESTHGVYDLWIVKLDGSGAIEWQNTIGGDNEDKLRVMELTADGGYICGGNSQSAVSDDKSEGCLGELDYWILKLNSIGEIEWQNTIGGDGEDVLRAISQTVDGGYIIGGYSRSGLSGDKTDPAKGDYDYWIVKLSSTGNIEWQRTIGGTNEDKCRALKQTFDGGYICGGASFSGISGDKTEHSQGLHDVWILKLNSSGDIEWQNTMGGTDDDILYALQQTEDGGYVFGGYSRSGVSVDKSQPSQGNYDYWVVKLNSLGDRVWDKTIGGVGDEQLEDIQITADGGFICAGYSTSGISGDKTEASKGGSDYWILKLDCVPVLWFADSDSDGFGNPAQSMSNCSEPIGFADNNLDCDDENENVSPLKPEIANYYDDNCNGIIDEGFCTIPINLSTTNITATAATVNWQSNGVAGKFKIRYSFTSSGTITQVVADPLATQFTLSNLQPATDYTWRIQSICGNEKTPFSKKQKFMTAAQRLNSLLEFRKIEAYPSPFKDDISISFSLGKACFIKVNLLDLYGRHLKTFSESNYSPGTYTVFCEAKEFEGGMYFVQVVSSTGEIATLKVVKQ